MNELFVLIEIASIATDFNSILALAKVIHSFARIGMELYLEANPQIGLSLRTVNMTKSAFSSILFNLDFFSSFVVKSKATTANQCKLSMKSCLGVFRNMKQVCDTVYNFWKQSSIIISNFGISTFRWNHAWSL